MRRFFLAVALVLASVASAIAQCAGGISQCPAASSANITDLFVVSQVNPNSPGGTGYTTRSVSGAQLASLFGSGVAISGTPAVGYVPIGTSPTTAAWGPLITGTVVANDLLVANSSGKIVDTSTVPSANFTGLNSANAIVFSGGSIATLGSITGGSGYTPSGVVRTLGTITPGSGYTAGTYTLVPLTGGTGTGLTATIIVEASGIVGSVALSAGFGGVGYTIGDVLSADAANLGGAGSGFSIPVATTQYLAVPVTGGTGTGAIANVGITAGGVVNFFALTNEGQNYSVSDVLSASVANLGGIGSGFSIPVNAVGQNPSAATSVFNTVNNVSGICVSLVKCYINQFQITDSVDNLSANSMYHNWWNSTIVGGALGTGRFVNEMDVAVTGTTTTPTNPQFTVFRPSINMAANFGGTTVTPLGAGFAMNPTCQVTAAAANIVGCAVMENDFTVGAGVNYLSSVFIQNILGAPHRSKGTRENVSLLSSLGAAPGGLTPGLDVIIQDGSFNGWPILDPNGSITRCYPHANTGNCGTINIGFDLSKYGTITTAVLLGPQSNGSIDGSFNYTGPQGRFNGTTTPTMAAGNLFLNGLLASNPTFAADGEGVIYLSTLGGLNIQGQGTNDDLRVFNKSGTKVFSIASGTNGLAVSGTVTAGNSLVAAGNVTAGNSLFAAATGTISFSGRGILSSSGAGTLQLGNADVAAPVAQFLTMQSVVAGTADAAGPTTTIRGALSSGAGTGGSINIQTTNTGAASTTQNSSTTAVTITGGATHLFELPLISTDATHTDATMCEDTTTHALYFGSGSAGICLGTSSERYKHGIADLDVGVNELMKLRPVQYYLNADHGDPNKLLYGFTAEQGMMAFPKLVGFDAEGRPSSFDHLGVVPPLVKGFQDHEARLQALERERKR